MTASRSRPGRDGGLGAAATADPPEDAGLTALPEKLARRFRLCAADRSARVRRRCRPGLTPVHGGAHRRALSHRALAFFSSTYLSLRAAAMLRASRGALAGPTMEASTPEAASIAVAFTKLPWTTNSMKRIWRVVQAATPPMRLTLQCAQSLSMTLTRWSNMWSSWNGVGVKRRRSVPRGTVG